VTRAIESVPEVKTVHVAFSVAEATVTAERCTVDVFEAIAEALQAIGYDGTVMQTTADASR